VSQLQHVRVKEARVQRTALDVFQVCEVRSNTFNCSGAPVTPDRGFADIREGFRYLFVASDIQFIFEVVRLLIRCHFL
jgi:hypothetical protein